MLGAYARSGRRAPTSSRCQVAPPDHRPGAAPPRSHPIPLRIEPERRAESTCPATKPVDQKGVHAWRLGVPARLGLNAGALWHERCVNGARPAHDSGRATELSPWAATRRSLAVTTSDHFTQVASVYESLRTTDEAPVQWLRQLLPERPITGVDVGCGTGRYSKLLRALLPEGSLLIAADISAAMLAELQASNHGRSWVAPLLSGAEGLPIRTGSLDLVTSFNSVHHFDLSRFLADAARVLRPDGQLFVYTRTPEQNARTIWGSYFPGFVEHERRLHTER